MSTHRISTSSAAGSSVAPRRRKSQDVGLPGFRTHHGRAAKARTTAGQGAPGFAAEAANIQSPEARCLSDFEELCSFAMDRALGIEKASPKSGVLVFSRVIDSYIDQNARWFAPVYGNLLDLVSQTVATSVELQRNWLTWLAPHTVAHASGTASSSGNEDDPAVEELAHSMDIAIGAAA